MVLYHEKTVMALLILWIFAKYMDFVTTSDSI